MIAIIPFEKFLRSQIDWCDIAPGDLVEWFIERTYVDNGRVITVSAQRLWQSSMARWITIGDGTVLVISRVGDTLTWLFNDGLLHAHIDDLNIEDPGEKGFGHERYTARGWMMRVG